MMRKWALVAVPLLLVAWFYYVLHPAPKAVAAATTVVAIAPADPVRVADCKKLMSKVPQSWLRSYSADPGGTVRAVVGPGFYGVTFEVKEGINDSILCIAADGRKDNAGVKDVFYRDLYTNKIVAMWSPSSGFAMN